MNAQSTPILTRSLVMARAWAIFRANYGRRPAGKGWRRGEMNRSFFQASLRCAWVEWRRQNRLETTRAGALAERIGTLKHQLACAEAIDNQRRYHAERGRISAALSAAEAEAAGRLAA